MMALLAYVCVRMYHRGMSKAFIDGDTADELITHMQALGFTVTRTELARWHRAGLLPHPQRHSLGRGRGMISVYPVGTANQLQALCEFHRAEKRLPYVAWRLWWVGYNIPFQYARQFLEEAKATWHRGIRELQDLEEHPEMMPEFIEHTRVIRFHFKPLTQARKRVGSKDFPTFTSVLVRIASGTFEGYTIDPQTGTDARERAIVEKAFGLRRARTERVGGAKPWLAGVDISEAFKMCSALLRVYPPGNDLEMALDSDLMNARDEVRSFLTFMESLSTTLDSVLGQGALGLSVLADVIRTLGPRDQAMMLLFWMMFRQWSLGEGMDALLGLARQWQQIWLPIFEGLEQLRKEVPATAEILSPKSLADALHRPAAMAGVLEVAGQLYNQYAPQIEAFLASHSELTDVLEASSTVLDSQNEHL
jgi:hypothetical protein